MPPTEMELVEGKHYHAWILTPTPYTLITTGQTITQLCYVAAKQPHANRQTAMRHARQMADGFGGKQGYMSLLCGGGPENCPYLFEGWDDKGIRTGWRDMKAAQEAAQEAADLEG